MHEKKQTYIAQYFAHNRSGMWNSSGQGSPQFRFEARDDEEALDIALSFGKKPMVYQEGARRKAPIPGAVYELIHLRRIEEIELKRKSPRKTLDVCLGKNGFNFFV